VLAQTLRSFQRMYRPHAAREDTALFPAFRAVVGRGQPGPDPSGAPPDHPPALRTPAALFARLDATASGRPAAHIAMRQAEAVRRREWLALAVAPRR
jgi:hypothetical protein